MAYTQDKRLISIHTPLGKDKLLLQGFHSQESISNLFSFKLDLLSEDDSIDLAAILDKPVTIQVSLPDGKSFRYFHGIINRFAQVAGVDQFSRYEAEMVPQLHRLSRMADCEIFPDLTAAEIAKKLLEKANITNKNGKGFSPTKYRKREYCVMYRETALNCLMRLLEEEGILFYFSHEDGIGGKDVFVFADTADGCEDLKPKEIEYDRSGGTYRVNAEDRVLDWRRELRAVVKQFSLRDHNFEMPPNKLEVSMQAQASKGVQGTVRDYPGTYEKSGEGDWYVRVRAEEEEVQRDVIVGQGTLRRFSPGYKFKLKRHPRDDQNADYLITSVNHFAHSNYLKGMEGASYETSFSCVPVGTPYRPPRITAKPVINGTQTAVVVGPSGDEIHTDKYGRIRVQFHWDRRDLENERSSCYLRVGTPWAGKNWGMIHIPRIGQEVIVSFLEGDPDRPIVVGSVYNADQMPPYSLPKNQTQSGVKSRSSKGGGSEDFNELRFEDQAGSEDVYFHAQKDFHRVVENNDDLKVGKDQTEEIEVNRTTTLKQGNDKTTIQTGNVSLNIQKGNQTIAIDLGKSEMEAMQSIELKVGQSSIKLDQMGVTIKGMTIKIEGQITAEMKSPMTTIKGDAILTAKGGLVMVN